MNTETYSAAQNRLLNLLSNRGWKIKPTLKVPQAISPDGSKRLFFRKQAVYLHCDSIHTDIRGISVEKFLETVEWFAKRPIE